MTDFSKLSCVVVDHGLFFHVAQFLGRHFGKVYYVTPQWEGIFSKLDDAVVGDGFEGENIERIEEVWDVIEKVDFAVFPDVHHGGMQKFIEKHVGVPVWGGRKADALELKKLQFKKLLASKGGKLSKYDVLQGLYELRMFCIDPKNADRWIKMSPQYRGNQETFHHVDYDSSVQTLGGMDEHFGILGEQITFLAEHPIKSKFEPGLDTLVVDGQHPELSIFGWEKKDKCYFGRVMPYNEIPKQVTACSEFLWEELKRLGARQMVSTEVKGNILLEPTIRFPSPAGEPQLDVYSNMPEVMLEGAKGSLVQPIMEHEYTCEAMIMHDEDKSHWRWLDVPKESRRWVKLYSPIQVNGKIGLAPGIECIGAIVGVGDDPEESIEHVKEIAETLEGQPVRVHLESLVDVLEELEAAQEAGMDVVGDEGIPEPAIVVEKTS